MSHLTDEERRKVLDQVPSTIAVSEFGPTYQVGNVVVVSVSPRAEGESERWVSVNSYSRYIDTNIEQPQQNRTVLDATGGSSHYAITYKYFDQLSSWIMWTTIATVFFCILTSPVILLCCIPMVKKMKRVIGLYSLDILL